ncbi:MAG: cyclodeaminase/cyclohydrolase family protein, partial [Elusimicrobia bacterium]|nr:cyclodeaminase/cyclohydrolase family protein [Elusimicrobiota bacterium]
MNKHIEQPLNKYLDALAAKIPSPGGGSAAALVASTGVSLLCMVANFTIGKKGYEEHQPEIKSILAKLESNRLKLNELIDKDPYVYEKVSVAYKLAKNTDEKKTQRELSIQAALKEAISVPFEIIEISINS